MHVCDTILVHFRILFHYSVPEDSPTDVVVAPFSVSSVLISWKSPLIPNGRITLYSLYVDFANGSQLAVIHVTGDQTQTEVGGLSPYQLVLVQVAARTAVGEGPRSTQVGGRSAEIGEKCGNSSTYVTVHTILY